MCSNRYIYMFKQIHLSDAEGLKGSLQVHNKAGRQIPMISPVSSMGSPSLGSPVFPGRWVSLTAYWKLLSYVGGRRFLMSRGCEAMKRV